MKLFFKVGYSSKLFFSKNFCLRHYNIVMIVLVGASASGKTEIAKTLFRDFRIKKAVTHTTRPMRVGEVDGVDYHFVTKEEFLRLKDLDAFVETTCYNGNYYGCSKAEIADDKCVIVDPNGLRSFLALGNNRIISFYLRASEQTRRARMASRGDGEELLKARIENDRTAFAEENMPPFDFILDTDAKTPEQLAQEVIALYKDKLSLR